MNGEIEAAGAAVTAGIAASAIEKGGAHRVGEHGLCANCGTAISGAYCPVCGQPTHVHRSLGHFIEEALHGVFHFDTKAWRTLPMLAFRPGTLTRTYTMGKRTRYISPVALFLFTIFVMFFTFALLGEGEGAPGERKPLPELRIHAAAARQAESAAAADLARAEAALAALPEGDSRRSDAIGQVGEARGALAEASADARQLETELGQIDKRIADLKAVLAQLDLNQAEASANNQTVELDNIAISRKLLTEALADPAGPPASLEAVVGQDGDVRVNLDPGKEGGMDLLFHEIREANANGKMDVNFGNKKLNEKVRHKLENPELLWYKIQNTAYKFSFLLIPISIPFVWLLFFWKRGVTLFDHAVFVLYSLSFMSLLFIALALLSRSPNAILAPVGGAALLAIPVHMFFQLKGGYAIGVFSALWRTLFLLMFALFSLSLFLVTILLLGVLG